jgi:hypothetical protein
MENDLHSLRERSDSAIASEGSGGASVSLSTDWCQPPRLGIIHLLGWVTFTAVLMKFNLALEQMRPPSNIPAVEKSMSLQISQAGYAILMGAILIGGCVFYADRYRRKPGRIQPGHWAIAIQSLCIPVTLILQCMVPDRFALTERSMKMLIYMGSMGLIMLLAAGAFFYGSFRLKKSLLWKIGLILLGAEYLINFTCLSIFFCPQKLLFLYSWIFAYFNKILYFAYFVGAYFFVVMVVDIVRGERRDWLHWLGVAFQVMNVLITLVLWVAMWWMQPAKNSIY